MDLENTIWKNLVTLLKAQLTDPLSRTDWIRAGFTMGLDLEEPLIIVDQGEISPAVGPSGIGSGKRFSRISFEIYILTDTTQYTIDTTDYRGPLLRDYYADQIRNLFSDSLETSMSSLGTGVTDVDIGTSTALPYYDDLGQYRKQFGIAIEILKT